MCSSSSNRERRWTLEPVEDDSIMADQYFFCGSRIGFALEITVDPEVDRRKQTFFTSQSMVS